MPASRWIVAPLILVAAQAANAQRIVSLGQPPRWQPYVVPSALHDANNRWIPQLSFGVHRAISNPVTGLIGAAAEAYVADRTRTTGGVRALVTSSVLGLSLGADWNAERSTLQSIASFQTAIRRGGVVGHGSMLRVDWLPSGHDAVSVGLRIPFAPLAGRTRPRDVSAAFPNFPVGPVSEAPQAPQTPLRPDAERALARASEAAGMLLAYTNLYPDQGDLRYGESYDAAMRAYHAALDTLFGKALARRARETLLRRVLIPYDSLFGQVKDDAGIRRLTTAAQADFHRWLADSSGLAAGALRPLLAAHARWLRVIEVVHASLLSQWRDSRVIWLPLQLALTAGDYDEQAEVDALIERVVGRPFTDRNALTYLRSADLPLEIARSIFAARDYHVLWTHDYTGRRDRTRTVDEIGYRMTADAYLLALTKAVARFDSLGRLPVYMLFVDQFFYEQRDGRLWLSILENPLGARISLPRGSGNAEREAHLRQRQADLRDAVRRSRLGQRPDAASLVKVHVSVMLPSDFSFRSRHIVPGWPFVPDNVMREHRKIVFYDVTESDPYRGATILMGVGVGEHYASATWEDRGYRIRGPAALEVRAAARRALMANGISERDLPAPLQPTERADAAEQRADLRDYVGRALQVHNEAGFGAKEASVARAMLYNLAPAGSVLIVPDPLWVSHPWAAMLAGAAARGCKVYVVAPSLRNNPNPEGAVLALENDVMRRLLQLRARVADRIARTDGELRVGLFTARAPADDVVLRAREVRDGVARYPWLARLFPFDSATLAVLAAATSRTEGDADATDMARDETPRAPQLHQKTQLIARPGAIAALLRQEGWDRVLSSVMERQSRETATFADQLGWTTPDVDSTALHETDVMLRGFEQAMSESERKAVSFYFTLGSQNMDPRGLMQDGEANLVVSGFTAAAGFVDFYYLMARTTWIDDVAELDRLLPSPGGWTARLARLFRPVF